MKSQIVEVTNGPLNWGKFLVAHFDQKEVWHLSAVSPGRPLLQQIGYDLSLPERGLWVLDLQTREGAWFKIGGYAKADLDKHKVWVCPMFEPFLEWLYANYKGIDELPTHVDLPEAPFSMSGYRREGKHE
jgi:hypothetical protein